MGSIDDEYDVAISTSCGPLDFIVVDTIDTCTKCINFLKENDLGRGRFLALDQQKEAFQHRIKTPFQAYIYSYFPCFLYLE